MLVFEENLYIIDGKNYLVYDGETVKDVKEAAFIPTTYSGRPPLGGGQQYQQVNRLQPTFKNSFLAEEGKKYLKNGGSIYMEIGWDQAKDVTEIFEAMGFSGRRTVRDMAGNDRVVCARKEK